MSKPTLRPIEDHKHSHLFASYTEIFRELRPAYPEAIVFEVNAGMPDAKNCSMRADTRTADGDVVVSVAKEWLRTQPVFMDTHPK